MSTKKGITMIALVLIVVILIVLTGISIATAGNLIENSLVVSFANDLKSIEETVKLYYIEHDEMPVLGENIAYSYGQVLDMVDSSIVAYFEIEANENGDKPENESFGSFYIIDLNKLDISQSSMGFKSNGDEKDIFVVSYPSMNVYYIKGLEVRGKVYFSLTKEISNLTNVTKDELSSTEIESISSFGITVKRAKKTWTNIPDFVIDATLNSDENLYIKLGEDGTEKLLTTQVGQNTIYFKESLNEYTSSMTNQKYNLGLKEDQISAFDTLEQSSKNIYIIKKSSSVVLGKVELDMSNYETSLPIKSAESEFVVEEDINIINLNVSDDISGIKEVRFDYLTRIDDTGQIVSYYKDRDGADIVSFDVNYMLTRGKKSVVSDDGKYEIEVPKDVEGIQIVVYDKAGNSTILTENTNVQNTELGLYAGIYENYVTSSIVNLDFVFNTNLTIESAIVSLSVDGVNYVNERTLTLTQNSDLIYTSNITYESLSLEESLYVKLIVNYDSNTKTQTIVKKIDIDDYIVRPGVTVLGGNKIYIDENEDMAVVPQGFKVSTVAEEQIIDNGLVILDTKGNEFVWIPVDGVNVTYNKWCTSGYSYDNINISDDESLITKEQELKMISKYGGFYVGRYEAGIPENQTEIDGLSANTSNTSGVPVSKKGTKVWVYIDYINAKANAESMINTEYVKSGLMTGTMWDTIVTYLQISGYKIDECNLWGNYKDSEFEYKNMSSEVVQKELDATTVVPTGSTEYTNIKNLYDIAGNVFEFTSELYSDTRCVGRGGSVYYTGEERKISFRYVPEFADLYPDTGFRIALYIM